MDTQEMFGLLYKYTLEYGMKVIFALLIFIIGSWVAKELSKVIEKPMLKAGVDTTLISFFKTTLYTIIMIFVFIAALSKLGVETTSFVAIVGAAGLAIGLALQGSLANFAAGVLIILFKYFRVGDTIEAGGIHGIVKEVQIFNTVIFNGATGITYLIPNSSIKDIAKIPADEPTVTVTIDYDQDFNAVADMLKAALSAKGIPDVAGNKFIVVILSLDPPGVKLAALCHTPPGRGKDTVEAMRPVVLETLQANNVKIVNLPKMLG